MLHPYWPLIHPISYQVNEITGLWHPQSMYLDCTGRTPSPINYIQTLIPHRGPLDREEIGVTYTLPGEAQVPMMHRTLWEVTDGESCGELYNQENYRHDPFIPVLMPWTTDKIITHMVKVPGEPRSWPFETRTRQITTYAQWGPWADCIRTGLVENEHRAYNYIFAKDIGMVHFWCGTLNPDNTLKDGYEWWAFNWVAP